MKAPTRSGTVRKTAFVPDTFGPPLGAEGIPGHRNAVCAQRVEEAKGSRSAQPTRRSRADYVDRALGWMTTPEGAKTSRACAGSGRLGPLQTSRRVTSIPREITRRQAGSAGHARIGSRRLRYTL